MRLFTVLVAAVVLAGCSTYMPQRYSISADNNIALKALNVGNINVGQIKGVSKFDNQCRAAGPLSPPDNLSFEGYIQKALADELKVAGMFDDKTAKVTLTGELERLEFSSSRAVTGGSWDIGLRLSSSNGKTMKVTQHYEFNSGYGADTACKQTAEAYLPAVQDLIGQIVRAPEFKGLVASK